MTYDRPIGITPLPALTPAAIRSRVTGAPAEGESFHDLLDQQESEPAELAAEDPVADWKSAHRAPERQEAPKSDENQNPAAPAPAATASPAPAPRPAERTTSSDNVTRVEANGADSEPSTERAASNDDLSRPSPSLHSATAGRDAVQTKPEIAVPAGALPVEFRSTSESAGPELIPAATEGLDRPVLELHQDPAALSGQSESLEQTADTQDSPKGMTALAEMVRPVGKAVAAALAMLRAAGRASESNANEAPVTGTAKPPVESGDGPVRPVILGAVLAGTSSPVRQAALNEGSPRSRQTVQAAVGQTETRLTGLRMAALDAPEVETGTSRLTTSTEQAEILGPGRVSAEARVSSSTQSALEGVLTPLTRPAARVAEAEAPVSRSAAALEMLNARTSVRPEPARREVSNQSEPEPAAAPRTAQDPVAPPVVQPMATRVAVQTSLAPPATPAPLPVPGAATAARLEALDRPVFQSATPLTSMSIPVGDQLRPSAVIHLLQQSAGVKVTVQSGDAGLSQALRAELPQLVSRLEDAGFQSDFQHRGPLPSDPAAAGILRSGSSSMRDSGFQESGARDSQAGASWSGRQQQRQSRLWKDLLQDERQHAKEGA